MRTHFNATVNFNQFSSMMSGGMKTREDALSNAFETATYYLGMYDSVEIVIEELCHECDGSGEIRVRMPRSWKTKRCQNCKGHRGPVSVLSFPARPHTNVLSIDNGTGDMLTRA